MGTISRPSLSREDFLIRLKEGRPALPLHAEIPYSSPASLYRHMAGAGERKGCLLLESVQMKNIKGPSSISRYSFIALEPYAEYSIKDGTGSLVCDEAQRPDCDPDKPLSLIRAMLNTHTQEPDPSLPPFQGGAAGLFSYDFVRYLEQTPVTTRDDLMIPDAHIFFYDRLLSLDHKERKAWVVVLPGLRAPQDGPEKAYDDALEHLTRLAVKTETSPDEPLPVRATARGGAARDIQHDTEEEAYKFMVRRAKEYIAAGDIFQANLSLRVSAGIGQTDPWELYMILREINPSPFAGYLDLGDYVIASSSPERLVRVSGDIIETRPIAGTRPRGQSELEDDKMRQELLLNEKERAEHIMLIDLERNDMGRVCDYGSVMVDELMTTEDYSHVIHIVSNVKGRLAKGKDMLDAIRAVFPGGTITGVPKVRCMEIIDELEDLRRGPYTGSFGYMGFNGKMDMNIIIRTFLVRDGRAYVQAGAGIVADSDPEREYRESLKKAEALIRTLEHVLP